MSDPIVTSPEIFRTRDLQGWDVVDRAGEKIGTVADLLFDHTGRVRMLDVEYGFPKKHFLVPQHQMEWGEQRFILGRWTRDRMRALPPYDPAGPMDAARMEEMNRAFPWFYDTGEGNWDAPAGTGETRVVPMSETKDFKIGSGAPDPRGWNVFGSDGERLGTVSDLLVDPAALKIRYLDVDLLDDLFHLTDDRHVLVPLDHVDLKERGNDVWVHGLTAAEAARLPAYPGGAVEPWMERTVTQTFGQTIRGEGSVG